MDATLSPIALMKLTFVRSSQMTTYHEQGLAGFLWVSCIGQCFFHFLMFVVFAVGDKYSSLGRY